ncbi:MAG: DUF2716 domain-containing protein, partial [Promethearchaeota archaeon]
MDAWIRLSPMEDKLVWRNFKKKFQFKPSVHKKDWPGFKEPYFSMTYDISSVFGDPERVNLEFDMRKKVLKAFKEVTKRDEFIYAFDWQHPSYKF